MRLGQTSIIYFVSKIIGSALGFLATVYFARELGEVVLGQYALVLALVTWLGIAGKVGFSSAITKRISEGDEPDRFAGAGIVIMASMMSVVALLVVLFRTQVNQYIGVPVAEFVVLLLFVSLYASFVNASLKGNHLVHVYAVLSSGKQLFRAVIQVGLVALGLGLVGMLWGYAIGYLITATIGLWLLGIRPALPQKRHVVSLFNYAKFSWLGSIRSRTFQTADIAVLGFFVSQGLIGIYSVAWSVAKFLDIFGSAISDTLFPEMSRTASQYDPGSVSGYVEDGIAYAGLILIPGFLGSIVIGDRLMAVYSDTFVAGAGILSILIFGLLVYTYTKQLLNTLNAVDRPDLAFRANGIFILANVILNVALVFYIGWVGAALATTLSAAVGLVIAFYYTRQLVDFAIPCGEISRQWIAALLMGLIVYLIRRAGEPTEIADYNAFFVVLLVGLGAGVYLCALLAISESFRDTVARNLPVDVPGR